MNRTLSALERLKAQKAKMTARIQSVEARLKVDERKKDTRRKILIGSFYLEEAIKNNRMDEIKKHMDVFLTRDSDRVLFDLPKKGNEYEADMAVETP